MIENQNPAVKEKVFLYLLSWKKKKENTKPVLVECIPAPATWGAASQGPARPTQARAAALW